MSANDFAVFFVLQASVMGSTGRSYQQQVSVVDPASIVKDARRRKDYFGGGFCFVQQDRIWNADGKPAYNADEVYCHTDDLGHALLFLQYVTAYLPIDKTVQSPLTEMTTFKARYTDTHTISMIGEAHDGTVLYEELAINASVFYTELLTASEAYLRFAQTLVELIEHTEPPDPRIKQRLLQKLDLPTWQATVDSLRQVVTNSL